MLCMIVMFTSRDQCVTHEILTIMFRNGKLSFCMNGSLKITLHAIKFQASKDC